jgi:hypothetical protein
MRNPFFISLKQKNSAFGDFWVGSWHYQLWVPLPWVFAGKFTSKGWT